MSAATVVISVFGLFHPIEFEIEPARQQTLTVECDGRVQRLEGTQRAKLREGCTVAKRSHFVLSIPGKIRREFDGILRVAGRQALVEMDLETAVASVVASEMPMNAGAEALAAQAIAARSYYAASAGRHAERAFCDSTHCQHIKGVISASHPAAKAARATQGMILAYEGRSLQAMYSAACRGRRQQGEVEGYPYFAVECAYCRRNPVAVRGLHEHGLCQAGAMDLARLGTKAGAILAHYYPGTRIIQLAAPKP